MRCGTVKWLSRRSIGQLVVIFASPSLPLILLMSTMGCSAGGEADVGVACALVETALMLCGATIGVLLAFEIHRERKRNDKERGGRPSEPGPPTKGSSEAAGGDKEGSSAVGQTSKNIARVKTMKRLTCVVVSAILFVTVAAAAYDTEEWDRQSIRTFHSVDEDTLFLSSATILAFAVFGSALTRSGQNKDLIESVVLALVAVVVIQMVFMMSLVLYFFNVPKMIWGGMTAAALLLLLPAMVASRILPSGEGGDAGQVG